MLPSEHKVKEKEERGCEYAVLNFNSPNPTPLSRRLFFLEEFHVIKLNLPADRAAKTPMDALCLASTRPYAMYHTKLNT